VAVVFIARRFGLIETSLRRHAAGHLPRELARAAEGRDLERAGTLLDRMEAVHRDTLAVYDQARDGGDARVTLAAIRELRANLELIGRLKGELAASATVAIIMRLGVRDEAELQRLELGLFEATVRQPHTGQHALRKLAGAWRNCHPRRSLLAANSSIQWRTCESLAKQRGGTMAPAVPRSECAKPRCSASSEKEERVMSTKLRVLWSGIVGSVLLSLGLLGTWLAPGASAPRSLWNTEQLHG
jgi:hypothetical protein